MTCPGNIAYFAFNILRNIFLSLTGGYVHVHVLGLAEDVGRSCSHLDRAVGNLSAPVSHGAAASLHAYDRGANLHVEVLINGNS